MPLEGTTVWSGATAAARRDGAAIRTAHKREMMERDAARQEMYRLQKMTCEAEVAVRTAEADLARARRAHADTLAEIEEAAERIGEPGYKPGRMATLRSALEDYPAMVAGAERRLKDACDALASLVSAKPEPEPVAEPARGRGRPPKGEAR